MNATETLLAEQLATLKLVSVAEQYATLASEAAQKQWPHVDYLARLIDSEAQRRHQPHPQGLSTKPSVANTLPICWNSRHVHPSSREHCI